MTAAVFFFFFPVQRRRLLPFLQWCSNGWEEDDELRKADYGVGSAAVFVLLVALVSRQPAVVALTLLFCRCFFSLFLSPCFSPNNSLSLSLRFFFPACLWYSSVDLFLGSVLLASALLTKRSMVV